MLRGPTVGRCIISPAELLYYSVLHLAFGMAVAEFSNHRNFISAGNLLCIIRNAVRSRRRAVIGR
jgi:hypothetical protein